MIDAGGVEPNSIRTAARMYEASRDRLLGGERPESLAFVIATVVLYAVLERWTGSIAVIRHTDLGRFSLTVAAIGNRWWLALPLLVAVGALLGVRRSVALSPWRDLHHGESFRLLAAAMIGLLAWQGALHDINFIAGRVHGFDRGLVLVLAATAIMRPVALVPFVLVVRIVNEQFLFPFGTVAAKNVDELLLVALLCIAAGHLIYVVTGRSDSSPTVLLLGAAVASHFFWPGKGKLASDWAQLTDISNLPLASYRAGWLGHTDGAVADAMVSFFTTFRWPVVIGTLVIEAGAVMAAFHPKLLRVWIPGFVLFHTMTFLTTGFFFLSWIILELGLLAILTLPRFARLIDANATPARGLLSAAAVVGGTMLFHPPGLAWFDAPVSYGYEIEAIGESGEAYHVPISAFAPLDQDVSFARMQLADRLAGSGGYGALSTAYELERLEAIDDFDELAAYENELGEPPATEEAQAFFLAWFDHANGVSGPGPVNWVLEPPDRFWTSRAEPSYRFDEPLVRLEVFRVASIHQRDDLPPRHESVLVIEKEEEVGAVTSSFAS